MLDNLEVIISPISTIKQELRRKYRCKYNAHLQFSGFKFVHRPSLSPSPAVDQWPFTLPTFGFIDCESSPTSSSTNSFPQKWGIIHCQNSSLISEKLGLCWRYRNILRDLVYRDCNLFVVVDTHIHTHIHIHNYLLLYWIGYELWLLLSHFFVSLSRMTAATFSFLPPHDIQSRVHSSSGESRRGFI